MSTSGSLLDAIYRYIRRGMGVPKFFFSILVGRYEGLDRAPVTAKRALGLTRFGRSRRIAVSPLPSSLEIWDACLQAYAKLKIWPISFSYPKSMPEQLTRAKHFMSPIVPGQSYTFADEASYINNYSKFSFALTHKKSGWDCFRHLEILFSGAIPYMPDAGLIPEFTMVHYPKRFMTEVAAHLRHSRGFVGETERQALLEYFNKNLTSAAMAKYLLRAANLREESRILFIDEAVVELPDYQSIFSLIGLKQILGRRVTVAFPADYVYTDWTGDATALYGQGFGYTRVLDTDLRNANESTLTNLDLTTLDFSLFDAVILGSMTRNSNLASTMLNCFPASKTVWLHGEDTGPSLAEIAEFTSLGVTVFAREIRRIGAVDSNTPV